MRRALGPVLLLVVSLALALGAAEYWCRRSLGDRLAVEVDERNLFYRYDEELGWLPRPGADGTFTGERPIHVRHNSLGLRDEEVPPRQPGRPRVAFFGDSFVWGYDAEEPERFTNLVRAAHPAWDVVNCGVSGYGTDQATLLAERLMPVLRPDVVVLGFNRGDRNDNKLAVNNGGYGKPLLNVEGGELRLENVPVPKLTKARYADSWLYRNLYLWRLLPFPPDSDAPRIVVYEDPTERIVDRLDASCRKAGARLLVLVEEEDAALVGHLEATGIAFVESGPALEKAASAGRPLRFTGHGAHWTPDGSRVVADVVGTALSPMLDRGVGGPAGPATAQ